MLEWAVADRAAALTTEDTAMTVYVLSSTTNGTTLTSFDPATDVIEVPGSPSTTQLAASGRDTVVSGNGYSLTLAGVPLADMDGSQLVFSYGGVLRMGSPGNDTYVGSSDPDVFILAAGGDDSASGGGRWDVFDLGAALTGADTIDGGSGQDEILLAGDYAEAVVLGDTIRSVERFRTGSGGTVRLELHEGLFSSAEGMVTFSAFEQTDSDAVFLDAVGVLSGFEALMGMGNDTVLGGDGDDRFVAGDGANLLAGRDGDDSLSVSQGSLVHGNNTMFGGAGNDWVTAERSDGDNVLHGGSGDDHLYGGDGSDALYAAGAQDAQDEPVADDSRARNDLHGGGGQDTLHGGAGQDTLAGDEDEDLLDGGGGNDSLLGGQGDDSLRGGLGRDVLDGGSGVDSMAGGKGDDLYRVDDGGDVVSEQADEGIDKVVVAAAFYTLPDHVENGEVAYLPGGRGTHLVGNDAGNVLVAGTGSDTLSGGAGDDTLQGSGSDRLEGGTGNDVYTGHASTVMVENAGEGIDTLLTTLGGRYVMGANIEVGKVGGSFGTELVGNGGDNLLVAGTGSCTLVGGAGDDTLRGGGDTRMAGGSGNDTYEITSRYDSVAAESSRPSGGVDLVISAISHELAPGLENLTLTGSAHYAFGNDLDNVLVGTDEENYLSGHGGSDTMVGGGGDDEYSVDDPGDGTIEKEGGGRDIVYATVSHVLGDNVEDLVLYGIADGDLDGTGNDLDNTLTGDKGDNVLDGRRGRDTLIGGGGNDVYFVDDAGDVILDDGWTDGDTVMASLNYRLGGELQNLVLLPGTQARSGRGNFRYNDLQGNEAANRLDGGDGRDTLHGAQGDDLLLGGADLDVLIGDEGSDTMDGGAEDDTYYVDSRGDVIVERRAQFSHDMIVSPLSWVLPAFVENLTLTGSADLKGTGNELDNQLVGNAGRNRLDGGAGKDTFAGGLGDDTYILDSSLDVVVEDRNADGYDTVLSSASATLSANIEKLVLTGPARIRGTGNNQDNLILGNEASNKLDGRGGADTLIGGAGNDGYHVDEAGDIVVEARGGGIDLVVSDVTYTLGRNLENLFLWGSAAIDGTGNELANLVVGNWGSNILDGDGGGDVLLGAEGDDGLLGGDGDDTLDGGAGQDILIGEGGRDVFAFRRPWEIFDIIADFRHGEDLIDLSALGGMYLIGEMSFEGDATGQLRYFFDGPDLVLLGSVDRDLDAEILIVLKGVATITSEDFIF